MGNLTSEEFDKQFDEAVRKGAENIARRQRARKVKYDLTRDRLVLELASGVVLMIPISLIQGLQTDDKEQLADFDLVAEQTEIHWHDLDVQFRVDDLIRGVFGTPNWMESLSKHLAHIGRKGGANRSEAKTAAARANGKKGGRPKKVA